MNVNGKQNIGKRDPINIYGNDAVNIGGLLTVFYGPGIDPRGYWRVILVIVGRYSHSQDSWGLYWWLMAQVVPYEGRKVIIIVVASKKKSNPGLGVIGL